MSVNNVGAVGNVNLETEKKEIQELEQKANGTFTGSVGVETDTVELGNTKPKAGKMTKYSAEVEKKSTEAHAGSLVDANVYKTDSAEFSKSVIKQEGISLEGYEQKTGDNGEICFEKVNADGSREWLRVVTGENKDGDLETKILHSFSNSDGSKKSGRVYKARAMEAGRKSVEDMNNWLGEETEVNKNKDNTFNFLGKNISNMQKREEMYTKYSSGFSEALLYDLDTNGDNKVSLEEFSASEHGKLLSKVANEDVKNIFNKMDKNNDGKLTSDEIQEFYTELDEKDNKRLGSIKYSTIEKLSE